MANTHITKQLAALHQQLERAVECTRRDSSQSGGRGVPPRAAGSSDAVVQTNSTTWANGLDRTVGLTDAGADEAQTFSTQAKQHLLRSGQTARLRLPLRSTDGRNLHNVHKSTVTAVLLRAAEGCMYLQSGRGRRPTCGSSEETRKGSLRRLSCLASRIERSEGTSTRSPVRTTVVRTGSASSGTRQNTTDVTDGAVLKRGTLRWLVTVAPSRPSALAAATGPARYQAGERVAGKSNLRTAMDVSRLGWETALCRVRLAAARPPHGYSSCPPGCRLDVNGGAPWWMVTMSSSPITARRELRRGELEGASLPVVRTDGAQMHARRACCGRADLLVHGIV